MLWCECPQKTHGAGLDGRAVVPRPRGAFPVPTVAAAGIRLAVGVAGCRGGAHGPVGLGCTVLGYVLWSHKGEELRQHSQVS